MKEGLTAMVSALEGELYVHWRCPNLDSCATVQTFGLGITLVE